jgi:RNA polymerase sigma factor (sigma-70 family)
VAGTVDVPRQGKRGRGLPGGEEVVRRFGGRLKAKAGRALAQFGVPPRADQVEEVLQEVYCRLLDRDALTTCRAASEAQAVAYLFRVVESVVVDQLRLGHAAKRGGGPARRMAGAEERRLLKSKVDPGGTPEDRLLAAERRRLLLAHWRDLGNEVQGERNLRILRLALIEGWSSEEIARIHKLKPSSIDTVVHRLRRRLSEGGFALPRRPPALRRSPRSPKERSG